MILHLNYIVVYGFHVREGSSVIVRSCIFANTFLQCPVSVDLLIDFRLGGQRISVRSVLSLYLFFNWRRSHLPLISLRYVYVLSQVGSIAL